MAVTTSTEDYSKWLGGNNFSTLSLAVAANAQIYVKKAAIDNADAYVAGGVEVDLTEAGISTVEVVGMWSPDYVGFLTWDATNSKVKFHAAATGTELAAGATAHQDKNVIFTVLGTV